MRTYYNRYILSLSTLLLLTTVVLSALSGVGLDVYFSLYLIETLILTELYVHFAPQARGGLNGVGLVLFAGFLVIVALKVIEIVWGIKFY